MNAHGALNITGPTAIYLGDDAEIDGQGFVNPSGDPTRLTIFVVGAHSLHINGNADFYGAIYAPEAEVEINGTSAFYGAVVGRTIQANGTGDIHLDATLSSGDAPQVPAQTLPSRLVH